MKTSEFKAWFEGFTESLDGAPSAKQWKRIKEQVAAIDGISVTPVYVDRYVREWFPYRSYTGYATSGLVGQNSAQMQNAASGNLAGSFDGHSAMFALGKAEAN